MKKVPAISTSERRAVLGWSVISEGLWTTVPFSGSGRPLVPFSQPCSGCAWKICPEGGGEGAGVQGITQGTNVPGLLAEVPTFFPARRPDFRTFPRPLRSP